MSEAKLRVVEQFLDGRTQLDLARFLGSLDPQAVVDFSEIDAPYAGVYRGLEQIESLFHQKTSGWREVQYNASNPSTGGDEVVIDCRRTARRHDGFGVEYPMRTVRFTVRQGKVSYMKLFVHRADALEAAGLAE